MSDGSLRLAITLGLLSLFVVLEYVVPARRSVLDMRRTVRQAGMALIGSVLARLALGGGLACVATYADAHALGVFNQISWPMWAAIVLSFLALDLAIWAQHLALHRLPFLWRLHRVHHSDTAMDVSTALRFHPLEILLSLGLKVIIVMMLGAPAVAVFAFEIALGAGALFNHANIALPNWLERPLRVFFVTPALHLIHHSPDPIETNSNYGFSFSFWDRIFRTYRGVRLDADGLIGLETWRRGEDQKLAAMLLGPFK